ncbi:peptidyl-prolyl cis-trans isomerase [Microvirga brassicacearum]|uniref:Parvulin-like PPIase n=1 Tax=Microvirga brassicacearum TaxID=2580413 RepID=A0A5N3P9I8_9HYPH|nr:peptidyl-prolyl cis-trans isomerase [Microvirga brassicacearum]KAB0266331.1 peptidylprolyl isomerase [Microvirga brassicacearum]
MLRGMRLAGQSLVGKIVATVLFGFLILSFAVWGIGDIFRTTPPSVVAQVGKTSVSVDQVRTAYNNELQRLGRQFRTVITPEQARAFGIDQRVLANLVTEAVMSEQAKSLGLGVSDQSVARAIMEDPNFRGTDGQFNRAMFDQALRNASLTEAGFIGEQRSAMARIHLAEAIAGDLVVPVAAQDALHRYNSERRAAAYFLLTSEMAGEIPAATPEQLQTFYNERKATFQAPEYRAISMLAVDAASLAKPDAVTDADARAAYEQEKAKFGTPERRTVQQITFPSQAEAEAAAAKLKEGATFDAIATERAVAPADLELGRFNKAEMLDQAVAEAAFGLEKGAVSGPVTGRFGPVIVRVTEIQPEVVRPFEEVSAQIRNDIAQSRARAEIDAVHDAIEDQRASARPLADIAKDKGLNVTQIAAIDNSGRDKAGTVLDLPEREALLRAVFASDIGADNEPLRVPSGGYVWYDVTAIDPAREKSLDEVREQVAGLWRDEEVAQRLSEKARLLTERLEKGEAMDAVANEAGASVKSASDLARNTAKDDLTPEAVNRIFAVPAAKAGNVANGAGTRAVFKVTSATVPPFITTTQEAERVATQLKNSMGDDLINQYIAQIRQDLGVTINPQALRQATGSSDL